MQLGMIGLGRMGANMVRRLLKGGHECVVFDMSPKAVAALAQEKKNLSDASEIGRIARAQYQLASPGQAAYEVLPPSGAAAAGTPYSGDPGSRSPVAPSASSELPPGAVTTTTMPSGTSGHAASRGASTGTSSGTGLVPRMLHALEFWR